MAAQGKAGFFQRLIASQLRKPSGWPIGWIMLRRLNHWNRAMNDKTLAAMRVGGGDRVVELGCGGGALLGMIAERVSTGKVIGIDWSPLAIRYCRSRLADFIARGKLELLCQDAAQLPLPADCIDCIASVNTVYFWPKPEAVFAECARVLRIGARLVLCNAVLSGVDSEDYPADIFSSHTVDEVTHCLRSLGFSQPSIDYGRDDHADFYTLTATLESRR